MSARDALSRALWDNYTRADKNAFIDAYAHELAEQVLGIRSTVPDLKASDAWKRGYDAALMVAADLIDPDT